MWVQGDCALLPIEYSTTEELAAYLWFRILQVRLFQRHSESQDSLTPFTALRSV
jgi:hypothetical protein